MIKVGMFFLICFSYLCSYSQIVISNTTFQALYIGVDNQMSIASNKSKDIVLKSDFGELSPVKNGKFTWRICSTRNYPIVKLRIFKKNTVVDSLLFKLVKLPLPTIMLGCSGENVFYKDCVRVGVRAEIRDFIIENVKVKVDSFTVTILKKSGKEIKIMNKGGYYSSEASKAFQNLEIDDIVKQHDFIVTVGCLSTSQKLDENIIATYTGEKYGVRW